MWVEREEVMQYKQKRRAFPVLAQVTYMILLEPFELILEMPLPFDNEIVAANAHFYGLAAQTTFGSLMGRSEGLLTWGL